jgi:hypothetical protein
MPSMPQLVQMNMTQHTEEITLGVDTHKDVALPR